jgi:hypothetical protein
MVEGGPLVCLKPYSSKALNHTDLAGLLTYSFFRGCLPVFRAGRQWRGYCPEGCGGAYSSGSVQDFHLIPFSSFPADAGEKTPKPGQKYKIILNPCHNLTLVRYNKARRRGDSNGSDGHRRAAATAPP